MYTLEQLQSKTFGELRKIGDELNVLPARDRRRRQSWIEAIAGVNPPLLQLLEVSPGPEVEQVQPIVETVETSAGVEVEPAQDTPLESKFGRIVYPRPAQGAISQVAKTATGVEVEQAQGAIEYAVETSPGVEAEPAQGAIKYAVETSPGVEVDRALSHKFLLCLKEGHNTLWYDGKNFVCEKWSAKTYCKRGVGAAKHQLRCHPEVKRLGNLQVVENSLADQKPIEVQATEPIEPAAKTSPGAEVDRVQHPIIEMVETFPAAEAEQAQEAIAPATKNLPGSRSKTSTAHQLLELFKSSAHIIEDSPGVKTEASVSESVIAPAAKISLDAESDRNPILMGIHLSDRFVARYSPPQAEIIYFQSDADGQLSLLNFEVESAAEPPDPDDFESLDAFREAITRWDWEHPSSSDHCEPSSVHCEPSSVHSEPLEVSLDSLCEWAPCPDEWYEPTALLEPSKVSELSPGCKSSITSDFFIPTFDAWGDRLNWDEPPDTGNFARLPKPKPPNFPPQAASQPQVSASQGKSAKLIPKLCHRVAAGNQPARSPPGGDA